jgi:hypothetical protein
LGCTILSSQLSSPATSRFGLLALRFSFSLFTCYGNPMFVIVIRK